MPSRRKGLLCELRSNQQYLRECAPPATAVQMVNALFRGRRPKGLLLEAIAWQLSKTFVSTPTADATGPVKCDEPPRKENCECFEHLVGELRNWKASSFRDFFQQDLSKLPAPKRTEYLEGFENMHKVTQEYSNMIGGAGNLDPA